MTDDRDLTYEDLVRLYVDKFGEPPKITGEAWTADPTALIIGALQANEPINQKPVPDGTRT